MKVKFAVLLFCVALLLLPVQAFAAEDVTNDLESLATHIKASGLDSDWEVIALSKAGQLTASERDVYLNSIKDRVNAKQLSGTDLDKTALVVKALGQDPTNYQNHDLIREIYSDDSLKKLMDFTYALTALSSDDYTIPNDARWTPNRLIDALVKLQTSSGGWGWAGDPNGEPDVDTTAMVLTALSSFQDKAKDTIDKGVQYLQQSEQVDGGFVNYAPNSNSTAQVIIALSSLDIDPTEGAFNKNGHNPVNSLAQYKSNGGYKWASFSASDDPFSNDQVIQGLVAYSLFKEGDQLFNFRSTAPEADPSSASDDGNTSSSKGITRATGVTESKSKAASGTKPVPEQKHARTLESSNQAAKTQKTNAVVTEAKVKKETKIPVHQPSLSKDESKASPPASVSSPKHQRHLKSVKKHSPEREIKATKTLQLSPLHLYLGSAFVLLGAIGLFAWKRFGGVRG
ncbi:prenyltransferase/squalene oxidase repeat-containing protein [Sporolactobacillus spathodeae]|uniref:Squalene cyclase C-terminal domain-containing protein n=1 Tax=Sporolactobacillus spathodeae TaxID=1465502 RepID=A0ABS2Q9K4_9BACL|nr:prenyltransferase/squalene oxidase repeat-containing protein [Sporolactobacillus spathodeae]MBM7658478.1 hypothetical protein [Sporolactobacillus spathodeae]